MKYVYLVLTWDQVAKRDADRSLEQALEVGLDTLGDQGWKLISCDSKHGFIFIQKKQ